MIRVENKKTIRHVADVSYRADKMRNLFAVIAIILTTVLFSGLFTIAGSLISSVEESTMRQVGTSAHGVFKYLTSKRYETLRQHKDIKEMSYSVVLGIAENETLAKRQTEIRYANDEVIAKMNFSMPTTGRLPQTKKELATDTIVLDYLGVPARLGETVTLQYSVGGDSYTEDFTLVGFWEGDIIASASQVWLDREYVEEILDKYEDGQLDFYIGSIDAEVNFYHAWNIESKLRKVITESGYSVASENETDGKEQIAYGVNWAYEDGSSMDVGTICGAVLIIAIIMFSGYLMISNVFLISVAKDVRFYGLLKTIGTTGKQIKVLINRQAMRICLTGIPIGLLFGTVTGGVLTPFVLGTLNTNIVKVSLKWQVFLFAAVFSLFTVYISIRKAAQMAAKVSPIEALRMTDVTGNYAKRQKAGNKISLYKMAWQNVGRNRKKAVFVTLSLTLSLVILNGAYALADGLDMNAYLSNMISHDFILGDASWFNVYGSYTDQTTISDAFLAELSVQSGMKNFGKIYFSEVHGALDAHWDDMAERAEKELGMSGEWLGYMKEEIENGSAMYHVYGVDDSVWEDFVVCSGEMDLEKLHSGSYAVVSPYDTEGRLSAYEIGDTVSVFGKDGESRDYEIIAIANIPYQISIRHSHPVEVNVFLPSDVFLEQVQQKCPMAVVVDAEENAVEEIEQFLADYCTTGDMQMQYVSRASYLAEYQSSQRTYKIVGTVASMMLALIGIANFANTSITSIMARKREFALLESIGMTVRQQRKVLILESIYYMAFTFGVTWTIGSLLCKGVLSLMTEGSVYFTLKYTILPSVLSLPFLLLLSTIIPMVSRRYMNRESVVERLRYC